MAPFAFGAKAETLVRVAPLLNLFEIPKSLHFTLADWQSNPASLLENLALSPSEFGLILIGKDGGIKLNSRKTSLEEIFSLIDTMPMRQEEMLNDKC